MFTQRRDYKKIYKTVVYTSIVVVLCFLVIALAWPTDPADANQPVSAETPSDDGSRQTGEQNPYDIDFPDYREDDDRADEEDPWDEEDEDEDPWEEDEPGDDSPSVPSGEQSDGEKANMNDQPSTYYIVKRAGDGTVKVYAVSGGQTIELETTAIVYEVLGPADQKLFLDGYRVNSQEELAMLLQDFEG